MMRERTIKEAIKIVLKDCPKGLTYKQIYQRIIDEKLYEFGAKNPQNVVHGEIRRHCMGIDFPSASPVKIFKVDHISNGDNYYAIVNEDEIDTELACDSTDFVTDVEKELLPEEKIVQAYQQYIEDLKHSMLDIIRNCHPGFFEKMVVDLLVSMGYGYDENAGRVIGKSHDGGVDGVISEDKLGLNLIYIQAKRYSEDNSVGRPEIQRFIGAMQKAEKGVFITTSYFTKEATAFADAETRKHIRLIDGKTLVDLMIKHGVGLEKLKEYVVYKVNEDYFIDK